MHRSFAARASGAAALLAMAVILGGCPGQYDIPPKRLLATPDTAAEAVAVPPVAINVAKPGDVLVAGGLDGARASSAETEFYQASSGRFHATGPLPMPLVAPGAAAVALKGGTTLLIAGGATGDVGARAEKLAGVGSAAVYNRATGTFVATGGEPTTRAYPSATTLKDGSVLFAGGLVGGTMALRGAIYQPATGTFGLTTGPMTVARFGHTATLLPDGTVLIVGGLDNLQGTAVDSAEIYEPSTGLFHRTKGRLPFTVAGHTATLIVCSCALNGQVLIAGGTSSSTTSGTTYDTAHAATVLYDPLTESFSNGPPMQEPRALHTATALPNGTVLIAGGFSGAIGWHSGTVAGYATDSVRDDAEIFDPVAVSFACVGGAPCQSSMTSSRVAHSATLLTAGPNAGKVLLAGGEGAAAGSSAMPAALATAELYDPSTGTFAATGAMHTRRAMHAALLLP